MPVEKRPRLSLIYNENTLFLLYGVVSLKINKTGKKETIQLETHVLCVCVIQRYWNKYRLNGFLITSSPCQSWGMLTMVVLTSCFSLYSKQSADIKRKRGKIRESRIYRGEGLATGQAVGVNYWSITCMHAFLTFYTAGMKRERHRKHQTHRKEALLWDCASRQRRTLHTATEAVLRCVCVILLDIQNISDQKARGTYIY